VGMSFFKFYFVFSGLIIITHIYGTHSNDSIHVAVRGFSLIHFLILESLFSYKILVPDIFVNCFFS
jgi:hypothetical protein